MLLLYKSLTRVVCTAVLLYGTVVTSSVNAQTGPNEISNELLKDSTSLLLESNGGFLSGDNFMIHYAKAIKYVNDMKTITYANGTTAAVIANEAVTNEGRDIVNSCG